MSEKEDSLGRALSQPSGLGVLLLLTLTMESCSWEDTKRGNKTGWGQGLEFKPILL